MRLCEHRLQEEPGVELKSAKRTKRERTGVHSWHPYYAGYSETFVDSAIDFLEIRPGHIVLDPWGGSGTTSLVASRRGISSVNVDINPVMSIFAAAKSPDCLRGAEEISRFFDTLDFAETETGSYENPEPLEGILCPTTASFIRSMFKRATTQKYSEYERVNSTQKAFATAVFFVCLRQLGGAKKLANPTWLKANGAKLSIPPNIFIESLQKCARGMLDDLSHFYARSAGPASYEVKTCDVKALQLSASSMDAIITSPPYLTRIDYAISTLPEMMFLGDATQLERIRHASMGAPVIKKTERVQKSIWGKRCNDVLNKIYNHSTKSARSYYWKNIIQYFMDMEEALVEIQRVLKPGGAGLIVVQSSYFKECEIELGEIYVEMSENLGLRAEIAYREEVKTHIAHVNTRSSNYVKNKIYKEDFVLISKKK